MLRKMIMQESGVANVVGFSLSLMLVLYLGYSGIMINHQGDVKVTVETAARVAARDYAISQDLGHAQALAYEVVSGSLPVSTGQYGETTGCQVTVETMNGVQYAAAVVKYRYPVLIPYLPELLSGASPLGNWVTIYGTAAFPAGT